MNNQFIEKAVEIHVPLSEVWPVFTDSDGTKQMGGYYDTDWKKGSPFGFRSAIENRKLTKGILLEYQYPHLIKHNLF